MDATVISLCLSLFPWAAFRKNKAGVKVNTEVDHDGYVPVFADISKAKTHENRMGWPPSRMVRVLHPYPG